ncbi:hypothetical protein QQ045_010270 [Rhodiola kirilowii]
MERQKLDFNGPVPSVRHVGPTAADVEKKVKEDISYNNFPAIPFYRADLKSGPISNPGTVPFFWEQIPGRPKHESKSVYQEGEELPPIPPRLPPGRGRDANKKQEPVRSPECMRNNKSQLRKASDVKTERLGNSQEGYAAPEGCPSEDDDDAYADAHDTLSRSAPLFDDCSYSLTGLSGMDGSDLILPRTVSTDLQSVDFTTGQAMTSETPPLSSGKKYAVHEHPKQGTVKAAKCTPTPDHKPKLLRHYIQNDIEEMDDEDDRSNILGKGCGLGGQLLPRFCLLSAVPRLRVFPQTIAKSVRTPRGIKCVTEISATKIREDGSSPGIQSVSTQNESFQCSNHDEKQFAGTSTEAINVRNTVYDPTNLKSFQDFLMDQNAEQESQCSKHDEKQFAGTSTDAINVRNSGPKNLKTFQDFLKDQNAEHESPPDSPVVEKTIHIDSGHTLCPLTIGIKRSAENFDQIHDNILDNVLSSDSSLQEIKHLSIADETKAFQAEATCPVDPSAIISLTKANLVTNKCFVEDESLVKGILSSAESRALQGKEIENQQQKFIVSNPPLPNSPSDSWLCRASLKNQSSRARHGSPTQRYSKRQVPAQKHDPKWETMVKRTKPQRHQGELTPISEARKSREL